MEILRPEELAEVEERLREGLSSEIPFISELGDYLYRTGGKRLRPTLAIGFYKLLGAQGEREALLEAATALELIHLATLVHDDIIDGSPSRRAQPSLWKLWGNRIAVLQGDFIFSRAIAILNRREASLRSIVTDAIGEILQGELLQEGLRWRIPTEAEYFAVVERKTAALFSAACTVGALLGSPELPEARLARVRQAGRRLGIAYQMIDDLLDIFGDSRLGKPTWKDWEGGWITLPFIRLLERAAEGSEERLRLLLQREELTAEDRAELLRALERDKIRERLILEGRALVHEAKQLLAGWGEPGYEQALFELMDTIVERER
ncbi:MAG: polyprenyl synthetase family protein [Candidatus Acetothermia bacterium]|nr:polyprenyl synthetase family protein [Candidatus Acetothermia bacterium]MDH7505734.1 polyprenyl synthetase family protein [Candidatus Acetothermia bacterium]